jgi:hypothetical protein
VSQVTFLGPDALEALGLQPYDAEALQRQQRSLLRQLASTL